MYSSWNENTSKIYLGEINVFENTGKIFLRALKTLLLRKLSRTPVKIRSGGVAFELQNPLSILLIPFTFGLFWLYFFDANPPKSFAEYDLKNGAFQTQ